MDICAPCDAYRLKEWGRNLHLEACCLNCVGLDAEVSCPTLSQRIYPSRPGGDPPSFASLSIAASGESGRGRGGNA